MIVNKDFKELDALERIVIPNKLKRKLGFSTQDNLHIQVYKDSLKTLSLIIEKE